MKNKVVIIIVGLLLFVIALQISNYYNVKSSNDDLIKERDLMEASISNLNVKKLELESFVLSKDIMIEKLNSDINNLKTNMDDAIGSSKYRISLYTTLLNGWEDVFEAISIMEYEVEGFYKNSKDDELMKDLFEDQYNEETILKIKFIGIGISEKKIYEVTTVRTLKSEYTFDINDFINSKIPIDILVVHRVHIDGSNAELIH